MFNNLFSERIYTLRKNKNISQKDLGNKVGLSKQAINDIEKSRCKTTLDKAIIFANYFNVSLDYLTGRIDEPNTQKKYVENFHQKCDDGSTLVNRIKQLADEKNTTISEIERLLDFGKATIAKWKTSSPSAEKLYKVANFLSVSVDYLLTGKNIYLNPTNDIAQNEVTCSNYTEKFEQLTPTQQGRILERIQTCLEIKNESDN